LVKAANEGKPLSTYIVQACGVVGILGVIGAIGYIAYTKASISLAVMGTIAVVATLAGFAVNWNSFGISISEFKDALVAAQVKMGAQAKAITELSSSNVVLTKERGEAAQAAALAAKAAEDASKLAQEAVAALEDAKKRADQAAASKALIEAQLAEARRFTVDYAKQNTDLLAKLNALQGKKVEKAVEVAKERAAPGAAGTSV
jgi:chromosome segregation ATPase